MRRILLALFIGFVPMTLEAQLEFSGYRTSSQSFMPQITYARDDSVSPKVRVMLWSLVNDGWSETVVGLDTKVGNLELSAGGGVETVKNIWARGQINAFYGAASNYALASVEDGGSGVWYLFELNTRTIPAALIGSSRIGIGARMQRLVGIGPRVEYELDKHFLVWVVPIVWDTENRNSRSAVLTLRYAP